MRGTCSTRNPSPCLAEPGGEQHLGNGWQQPARKAAHRKKARFSRGTEQGTANSRRAGPVYTGLEEKEAWGSRISANCYCKPTETVYFNLNRTLPSASIQDKRIPSPSGGWSIEVQQELACQNACAQLCVKPQPTLPSKF